MTLSVRLRHSFDNFELNVAFDAPPGITVLFGSSGCGKSTIIKAIAGLIRAHEAQVSVDGRVLEDTQNKVWLPPHKRRLATVFQEGRLFPHLSVQQNLAYGRWLAPHKGAVEEFDRVVAMLGIEHLLNRLPGKLSGGEKQRVAIGRALLANPVALLADEPLAALDEARKEEILPYFERLRDETTVPILYVSHAAAEVARLATSVVALENGTVVGQGDVATVLSDPTLAPTGVRAMGAILETQILAHHADGLTELAAGSARLLVPRLRQAIGDPLRVRIAAQDVLLSRDEPVGLSALNVLAGKVEMVRAGEGPGAIVSVATDAGRVLARITRRSAEALGLSEGVSCYAIIKTVAFAPDDVGGGSMRMVFGDGAD